MTLKNAISALHVRWHDAKLWLALGNSVYVKYRSAASLTGYHNPSFSNRVRPAMVPLVTMILRVVVFSPSREVVTSTFFSPQYKNLVKK